MKRFLLVLPVLLCVAASVPLPTMPKKKRAPEMKGAQKMMALAAVPLPVITRITLVWTMPPTNQGFSFFVVLMGTNQGGPYPTRLVGGTTNSYTLTRTNWNERGMNHYFVVRDNFGYEVSKEVRHPVYPDVLIDLTWNNRVRTTVEDSTDFVNWVPAAIVTETNKLTIGLPNKNTFWRLHQPPGTPPDKLQIRKYNPKNNP